MIKRILYIVLMLFLSSSAYGVDYEYYIKVGEGAGTCLVGDPCSTLAHAQALLAAYGDDPADTITISFNRSDTWTGSTNSDIISVNKSNVTLDAYGAGAKPIIDGGNNYPTGYVVDNQPCTANSSCIPTNYAIDVGGSASCSNVSIKNLHIKNMYPGGAIRYKGTSAPNGYFTGTATIEGNRIEHIGWGAISIYRLPSADTEITNNEVDQVGEWPKDQGWTAGHPIAIATPQETTDVESRYNVVYNSHSEGIGAHGMDIVEYNLVYNMYAPAIYYDPAGQNARSTIIRWNLLWGTPGSYPNGRGIAVDDEKAAGTNTSATIDIYGNIAIGWWSGIDLRNREEVSNWGQVNVYQNILIDNGRNFVVSDSDRFNDANILNNASIIYDETPCVHVGSWDTPSWTNWDIGVNYFYGDLTPKDPFDDNAIGPSGTSALLGNTSGWRSLSTTPSLDGFTPQIGSDMIDNVATDDTVCDTYDLISTGEFTGLPATESLGVASQSAASCNFGAIKIASAIPTASGHGPVGEQACQANPQTYSQTVETNIPADCKWHLSDVAYASMANTYDTVDNLSHYDPQSEACGSASITHYTRCQNTYDNSKVEVASTTNIFTIGDPPAPQPAGGGGTVSLGSGIIGVDIGSGSVDIGIVDLM